MSSGPMGRSTILSLDGIWDFSHASDGVWRKATVPQPWQAEFADLRLESGRATYKRSFTVPDDWAGMQVSLHFGAVSYLATVSVNGHLLGSHEGGYLPFEFLLPQDILKENNEIFVLVTLPDGDERATPETPFAEIPHGKQSWYGPLGGLWQTVQLIARDARHVAHCQITADLASGIAHLTVKTSDDSKGASLIAAIIDDAGAKVAEMTTVIADNDTDLRLAVPSIKAWSPDHPLLYRAIIRIEGDGKTVDETSHSFGFRHFETRDGKFYLNGQAFYMRGALDQDYYPEGICTPPSVAFLEDQFRKAKALGLNLIRTHIKIADPRYYEVADRIGMVIWTEIPNVQTFSANSARRMRDTMEGILARDFNHPSIAIWTIINEDWGMRMHEDATHRQWLKDTYDWLKALDPTRLVVDNSPCHFNFHVKTDINDFHYYRSVPERRAEWDKLTEEFSTGADWTYTPFGDGERKGDEPLVVSEFGVWGLPNPKSMLDANGKEPWWMETGPGWGDGAAYPHSVETRFNAYRLGSVFGSFDQFIEHVQWYQYSNLKYEIEVMRSHASIQGYVITELTDVHWEANGLMDLNRNPRIFGDVFPSINTDIVIVPKIAHYAGTSGDDFTIGLGIASGGRNITAGSTLHWNFGGHSSGQIAVPPISELALMDVNGISIKLPDIDSSEMVILSLSLRNASGLLAENAVQIAVYPRRNTTNLPKLFTTDDALKAHLASLGYSFAEQNAADLTVARALDASDIDRMQKGARYVVLADGSVPTHRNLRTDAAEREQPFMPIIDEIPGNLPGPEALLPNINLINRQGTMWRGDWIASFSWIRRAGAFSTIPGGPMLDLSFDKVVPHYVMTGFRNYEFGGAVHAGLVVGWVHKPAVTIGERRVGKGGLVATTFRLMAEKPGADPVASALFDAVIQTAIDMAIEK